MKIQKKILAIIPARGGSKRLPNKNSLQLGDVPLITHSINYAKENLNLIDKIVVSTDDDGIKKIAIENRIEVIDRPTKFALDTTPTVEVLQHVLASLQDNYTDVILLQPTNPLRPANLLKDALKIYEQQNLKSLLTVSPKTQKFGIISDGSFIPDNYKFGQRSQSIESQYFENGLLYITNAALIKKGIITGANNFAFVVKHIFGTVDIDTQEDFNYATYVLQNYKNML